MIMKLSANRQAGGPGPEKTLKSSTNLTPLSFGCIFHTTIGAALSLLFYLVYRQQLAIQELTLKISHFSPKHDAVRESGGYIQSNETYCGLQLECLSYKIDNISVSVNDLAEKIENLYNFNVSNGFKVLESLKEEFDYDMKAEIDKTITNTSEMVEGVLSSINDTVIGIVEETRTANNSFTADVKQFNHAFFSFMDYTNRDLSSESEFVRWQLAGIFTLLAILFALYHISLHMKAMSSENQNYIAELKVIIILFMVPIYASTSWISLVSPSSSGTMDAIQDFYEAVVIYTFLRLLIVAMYDPNVEASQREQDLISRLARQMRKSGQDNELTRILSSKAAEGDVNELDIGPAHLPIPCFCMLENYSPDDCNSVAETWLFQCQVLALQFVLIKPLLAVLPPALLLFGISAFDDDYSSSESSPIWSLWLSIIENTSVTIAFYGLICFFHGTLDILEWVNPWPKFLCVKGVVFMTFYQEFVIYTMADLGAFSTSSAQQYQALLICIEMFLFSIGHFYYFVPAEWENTYKEEKVKRIAEQKKKEKDGSYVQQEWYVKQAIDDLFSGIKDNLGKLQQKRDKGSASSIVSLSESTENSPDAVQQLEEQKHRTTRLLSEAISVTTSEKIKSGPGAQPKDTDASQTKSLYNRQCVLM